MPLDKVFPTALLDFEGFEAGIAVREISGGESLSGVTDTIVTDGGGQWFVEASDPYLDDPEVALAWRALSNLLAGGTPIIFPLTDARGQMMGEVTLPVGGLPWWPASAFSGGSTGVTVSTNAALRATALTLAVSYLPQPIRFGQIFSINHPTMGHRAYSIIEVVSDNGSVAVVKFAPPLREATTAGAAVDFVDPKCVMRLDGEMRAPRQSGFANGGTVRFVEHFAESYS